MWISALLISYTFALLLAFTEIIETLKLSGLAIPIMRSFARRVLYSRTNQDNGTITQQLANDLTIVDKSLALAQRRCFIRDF